MIKRDRKTGRAIEVIDLGKNTILDGGLNAAAYLLAAHDVSRDVDTTNWKTATATDPVGAGSMSKLTGRVYHVDRIVIGDKVGPVVANGDITLEAEKIDPKHDSTGFTNAPSIQFGNDGAGGPTDRLTVIFKLETTEGNSIGMTEAGLATYRHYDSGNANNAAAPATPPDGTGGVYSWTSPAGGLFARRIFSVISKASSFEFEFRWTVVFSRA